MKLDRLRDLQARIAEVSDAIAALIRDVAGTRDPLGALMYRSRSGYNLAVNRDRTKHQREVEDFINRSYAMAIDEGFCGTRREWFLILSSTPHRQASLRATYGAQIYPSRRP